MAGAKKNFVLKGTICFSRNQQEIEITEQGYLVILDGISEGVFPEFPEQYKALPVRDYGDQLIIPGMTDLHLHAPQYTFRGLGMDLELMDWLKLHTFPEEARYCDLEYAEEAYDIFAEDLKRSATTRAVIFTTLHSPATKLLMDKLEGTGLVTFVGKVNMDRNGGENLCETTAQSLKDTESWICDTKDRYQNTKPILTPRFTVSCSDELMAGLGVLREKYELPLQSHLSENPSEIALVKKLCPWSETYGDTYEHFHQLEGRAPAVMAHCVYSSDEEIALLKRRGTFVAHCPQSNTNLSSGIAPAKRYLQEGLKLGLGTDLAGGACMSMFRAIQDAVAVSKLRWRLVDHRFPPLTTAEAFYLATLGGGAFFGKVGSFEKGYAADALVLDDSGIRTARNRTARERLEQFLYLAGEGGKIATKYVNGQKIYGSDEAGM